jgi:hypothetical protein
MVVFHFAALNSLSGYAGLWAESWLFPKALLLNRWHIRGVICTTLGTLIIVVSAFYGLIDYGIFLGGALIVADPFFSLLALRDYRKGKRRA